MTDIIITIMAGTCLVWMFLVLGFVVYTYKDAQSRGMSGLAWALVVFFLPILGFIIYLIARRSKKRLPQPYQTGRPQVVYREKEIIKEVVKIKCPYCGSLVDQGLETCPNCGAPL